MDFQLPVGPNETVPLRITEKQRKLIVEKTRLPKKLTNKLRFGVHEDNLLVFDFTLDELDELAEHLAATVGRTKQTALQNELAALYNHILEVLLSYTNLEAMEEEHEHDHEHDDSDDEDWEWSPLDLLPPPIAEELERLMEQGKIRTQKQLERKLHELAVEFDKKPLPELQGLSMEQVVHLAECDWQHPASPLHLDTSIPFSDLQGAEILLNTRIFMQAIEDAGRVKATATGNLNRNFVSAMLDTLRLPKEVVDRIRSVCKVINETDVEMVGRIRWLLESLKLLRRVKGFFQLTKNGRMMLKEDSAGILMGALFEVHMRHMNLGYSDILPESPELEETMGFTLYCLDKCANDWISLEELAPKIFIPAVAARMEAANLVFKQALAECAECRLVNPLVAFGLLECRTKKERRWANITAVRKTPLFNRFLHFAVK